MKLVLIFVRFGWSLDFLSFAKNYNLVKLVLIFVRSLDFLSFEFLFSPKPNFNMSMVTGKNTHFTQNISDFG